MPESYLHDLPAGYRVEEYEILRVLGAGGFGITYLAYDHTLDGPVALKEYFPAGLAARTDDQRVEPLSTGHGDEFRWGLERFLQEARTLHRLRHPNVVRVLRFVEAHGTGYIVMEYVEGKSLAAVLEHCGRLTPAQWRPSLDQLLDGLAHVHDRGHLHRDIKPANIVIQAADGTAVLIDFGAARAAASDRTHTRILTPAYAPIEQHATGVTVGPPADLYALAAVSYRALTGAPPPAAPDRMLDDKYEPLAERIDGADRNWLAAIDWALALRPGNRPPTVTAWRESTHVAGQFRLGEMYEKGRGVPQNYTQAAAWYRTAAEQGHADAQFQLCSAYSQGRGVPKDFRQYSFWLHKAIEHGHADAQCVLGQDYALGLVATADATQAVVWFRKAAEQGHVGAQCRLAEAYLTGQGVPQDYAQAATWYRKAAEHGAARAQLTLGRLYSLGRGVPEDQTQALAWFRKAAEQGNADAQFELGNDYYLIQVNYMEALTWYGRAAEQGHAGAQYFLGGMYANGAGVPQDYAQALVWYRKVAEHEVIDVLDSEDGPQILANWYRKSAKAMVAHLSRMCGEGQDITKDRA